MDDLADRLDADICRLADDGCPHPGEGPERLTGWRRELCERNVRLAFWVIQRHFRSVPQYLREEMESEALEAMVRAALRFDPTAGVRFSTYATTCVWRAVSGWLSDRLSRESRARHPDAETGPYRLAGWEAVPGAAWDQFAGRAEPDEPQGVAALLDAAGLSPGERRALCLYYGVCGEQEHTLGTAGKAMGVSNERVRQLCRSAEAKVRAAAREG